MTQNEFYSLAEVREQIFIQKTHRHGSDAHKAAFEAVGEIAKKYGVYDQYSAADGGKNYN